MVVQPATVNEADGLSLIELLVAIAILGILATVVVVSVSEVTGQGEDSACSIDERTLSTAVEAYLGKYETASIPATGSGDDRFEATLRDGGFVRNVSVYWNVDGAGLLTPQAGSGC